MGDVLNCDMAMELMALDGIPGKMCPFHDDCLSVDTVRFRGIAEGGAPIK